MAIVRTINMDTAKKLSLVFILFIEKARGSIEISHFCFLFNYISTCFLNQRYSYRYDPCICTFLSWLPQNGYEAR